jgi:hypothetical protein
MNISDWIRKQLGRLSKSNWTKLFIAVSVTQLFAVIALESRVLHRNIKFRERVIQTIDSGQCDNDLQPSRDRMSLIITENASFILFQVFQLWFCINALVNQNTIQIITLSIINFLCGFFGLVQIFEIIKWTNDLMDLCEVQGIQKQFMRIDAPLVAVLILFALIMALICFKLYQEFGWNIYKKIGADLQMQKIYKTMLIFVMLLKLDLFFVLLMSVEVFFAFGEDKGLGKLGKKLDFTFILPKYLYYFHLGVTILIFFLELIAYRSVRKESKTGMKAYIALSVIVVIDFVLLLRYATSTVENSWYFFIVFLSVAIILCSATWVYAILVYRNFEKGLEAILSRNKNKSNNDDPEVGSSTPGSKVLID